MRKKFTPYNRFNNADSKNGNQLLAVGNDFIFSHNKVKGGLWASPLSSDDWNKWTYENDFRTNEYQNKFFIFKLKTNAKIYVIRNQDDLANISADHPSTMAYSQLSSQYDMIPEILLKH